MTCSKLTIETLEQSEIGLKLTINTPCSTGSSVNFVRLDPVE